jgi:outer membrane usher protein
VPAQEGAPQEGEVPTLPSEVPPVPSPEPAQPPAPATLPVPAPAPAPTPAESLEPEIPDVMQAPFDLFVNHAAHGQIVIVLAEGDVFVRREDLTLAGIGELGGVEREWFGDKMLSLKSVSPPLKYELDEREIALHITAPVDLLPTTAVDFNTGFRKDIEYQEKTSAFLNYAIRTTDVDEVGVYQEMGVSHAGNLLFSSASLSSKGKGVRGMTNFTINERETRRRMIFGDTLAQTGNLGSAVFLGGFTLQRNYDLDPYAITAPRLGFSGTTLTPSTLDVYVNGSRVRSEQIAPGSFQINNLRVGGGQGTATYVLRDVFGNEQTISMPYYIASSVLAKGLDEFSYSLGMMRDNFASESWDYHRPALMGRHRYGITNNMTLQARLEASDRVISGGPAVTAVTQFGQMELEIAGSGERSATGGGGLAAFASYTYLSRVFSAGTFLRYTSDRYSTLSAPAALDRPLLNVSVYQNTPVTRLLSVSTQGQYTQYRDAGKSWFVNGSAGMRIVSGLTANLSAGYLFSSSGNEWSMRIALNYLFAQKH